MTELLACPFCGSPADVCDGLGTQFEIGCANCNIPTVSVQISDLMTIEERESDCWNESGLQYSDQFVKRAFNDCAERWNIRAHTKNWRAPSA